MNSITTIISNHAKYPYSTTTVNSLNKTKSTVNSNTVREQIKELLKKIETTPEGVAQVLAESLEDFRSLNYYLILAKNVNYYKLLEALSYVKDADRRGKIKTKKAVYFIGILRNWNIKTKFKEDTHPTTSLSNKYE